jgi:hypothetical protein
MKNTIKLNKLQAYKLLLQGKDIILYCHYYERTEEHIFEAKIYGHPERKIAFYHELECIKNDFKNISTFYRGNKLDCKFHLMTKNIDV